MSPCRLFRLPVLVGLLTWAAVGAVPSARLKRENNEDPELHLDPVGIIRRWGYPAEAHQVVTSDGYILTLHRIPYGRNGGPSGAGKPVAFVQHGLLGSSATFLANLPNETLSFILADNGYDVWLGNVRGDTYSRAHQTLNPDKDPAFWHFSWDEMAKYDLPAMVNYVLGVTGQAKLDYIAHSQGTLMAFAEFSQDLQFAQKIKKFFALGPVSTLGHITSPLKYFASLTGVAEWLFNVVGWNEFSPSDPYTEHLSELLCHRRKRQTGDVVCDNLINWVEGFSKTYTNETRIPVYLAHSPAGTSSRNIMHFGQGVSSGQMQMYDFGAKQNLAVYGQATAPLYHVEQMTVPTVLFSGGEDSLADPTDVASLAGKLKNLLAHYVLPDFNHLDFTYGLGAAEKVYPIILKMMAE